MKAKGVWKVYAARHPSNMDGEKYIGPRQHRNTGGWFWLRQGGDICLYVRVHGLVRARYIARMLNRANPAVQT